MTIIVRDETVYLLTQMRRLNQEKKYDMTNENNIKKNPHYLHFTTWEEIVVF